MRRHGWGGELPRDDDEARRRIVEAAIRCVDEAGADKTTLAAVASLLGVTRQTVYRYYASTDDLFAAVTQVAAEDFLGGLRDVLHRTFEATDDLVEALVEAVAFSVEQLPGAPLLNLLEARGQPTFLARSITSPPAVDLGARALRSLDVDWEAAGVTEDALAELTEVIERLVQSLVLAPSDPPRGPGELRAFLRRWLEPLVRRVVPATSPRG